MSLLKHWCLTAYTFIYSQCVNGSPEEAMLALKTVILKAHHCKTLGPFTRGYVVIPVFYAQRHFSAADSCISNSWGLEKHDEQLAIY